MNPLVVEPPCRADDNQYEDDDRYPITVCQCCKANSSTYHPQKYVDETDDGIDHSLSPGMYDKAGAHYLIAYRNGVELHRQGNESHLAKLDLRRSSRSTGEGCMR